MSFSQNDLVRVTREIEVTEGVVVGGARDRVYGSAPTWTPEGSSLTSPINTGLAAIHSIRAGLRAAGFNIPSALTFRLNDTEREDFFRDTYAGAEKTYTDAVVDFVTAATHQDGSTGPAIIDPEVAGPFLFADIGDGSYDGAMIEISGAAVNAANKWPRPIKAVSADGKQIDLDPTYVTGAAGEFGEPLFAQAGVTATLRMGDLIRTRAIDNIRSSNLEFEFPDQPGGSFLMVRGGKCGTWRHSWDGKGDIMEEYGYTAMDYDALSTTTQGNGTVNENAAVTNPHMVAGEDLAYLAIGVTQLAGVNVTSFSVEGNGNAQGIDDVSGPNRGRAGVTVGDVDVTGSIKVYHRHAQMAILQGLGRSGNLSPLAWKIIDPLGNFYWARLPKVLFEPGGPVPGAKGSRTDGTFNWRSQLASAALRTMIWQRFDKP
ncbi:MAG TPA: hypothetical protein DCY40_05955 [Actinobacteria bacterium]|nr:hypothetical protein [Actinomycetota bacterium]